MEEIITQKKVKAAESHLVKNILTFLFSIGIAYALAQNPDFKELVTHSAGSRFAGSFIGGLFFTSLFTTGPALVVLANVMGVNGVVIPALIGGVGAVVGDLVIFEFLKTHVTDELERILACPRRGSRFCMIVNLRIFRWFMTFLGALIIASPLPDEVGLMMMGIGKLRPRYLIPISYALNTLGITALGLTVRYAL